MEKRYRVKRMFDSIAHRYDLLNHLLSFGVDFYWRRKALKCTKLSRDSVLLDVACGTGDFAIATRKIGVEKIFGADLSREMLELFKEKSEWIKGRTVQMVAENIPIKRGSVTNVIVAFGVRNFFDMQKAFDEFYSVLKPDGQATILEFRMPTNKFFKAIYKFYFKKILPGVGKLISKDPVAYTYLPESVEEFDQKIKLPELLRNSGFRKIEIFSLTFGIVQLIVASKQL